MKNVENFYDRLVKSLFLLAGEIFLNEGNTSIHFYDARSDLKPEVLSLEGLKELLSDKITTDLNGISKLTYSDFAAINSAKTFLFCAQTRPKIVRRYTAVIYPSGEKNRLYFTVRETDNTENIITFQLKKSSVNFNINDILYIGYGNHCVQIHKADECISMFSISFPDAADVFLKHKNFVRSYKNCLVNMDKVKCIENDLFVMTNNEVISIPKRRLKEIKNIYKEYVILKN
ncbi:MAG: LytTR family transcriptional regulator [Clostridia bacterium]|nr:LytTR family transcriptional regulator [Clostridia bacterium]